MKLLALTLALAATSATGATATASETTWIDETETALSSLDEEGETVAEEKSFDFGLWLKETFTPEVVAAIISAITAVGALLKMASSIKSLAKNKAKSADEIAELCAKAVNEAVSKYAQSLKDDSEANKKVMDKFAKILALSQENTPEARVAILELIQDLGTSSKEVKALAEGVKKAVDGQVEAAKKAKEAVDEKLDEIIDDGTSI